MPPLHEKEDQDPRPHCDDSSKRALPNDFLNPVIICILAAETGERFAFFGFRALLVLYFKDLVYSDSQAVALFSYVNSLAYFSPLFGAIVADGWLGRYQTILKCGMVYLLGLVILTFAAWHVDGEEHAARKRFLSFCGLFFACMGTGGIKPCVSAFGADQIALQPAAIDKLTDRPFQDSLTTTATTAKTTATASIVDDHIMDETLVKAERVRSFFNYFYFCINMGALASISLVPLVRGQFGFGPAFLLTTLFMTNALWLFWSKRESYVHEEDNLGDGSTEKTSLWRTFQMTAWLLHCYVWNTGRLLQKLGPSWARPGSMPAVGQQQADHALVSTLDDEDEEPMTIGRFIQGDNAEGAGNNSEPNQDASPQQNIQLDDAATVLHVLPVMAMFPIFWCLYDQQGSVWTLQATRMTLPTWLQPEQLNVINPLEIMIFIPLFEQVIYPAMRKANWNLSPLVRMSWGMLLTALAFTVSGLVESALQYRLERNLPPLHVSYQLVQITILSVGEIFVSVTGLEFAYATSPARLKAFLMAVFLLTTAVGDLLSGLLYSSVFANMNKAHVMYACASLMVVNWVLFQWVAAWYHVHSADDFKRAVVESTLPDELESDGLMMQDSREQGLRTALFSHHAATGEDLLHSRVFDPAVSTVMIPHRSYGSTTPVLLH